ncbi:MAG: hypothetical protein FVQ79_02130 [Planctomycetes bacterium]|nr:hypothetical protein [Planctomycetota bacterium]
MKIAYKNVFLERCLLTVNLVTAMIVVSTFVSLYGFLNPLFPERALHIIQIICFLVFVGEKTCRYLNTVSKREFFYANWFEIPLLSMLTVGVLGAGVWFAVENPAPARMLSLGLYLIVQVVWKACKGCVRVAASGKNPTKSLIGIFLVLIIVGAGLLTLPRSYNSDRTSFVDALFTATSATCVTGLVVQDTGSHFSMMGQVVILSLIQLGGLGIVIFGAVLALLLGQALSVRESVAMQDLLSARTLGRIGNIIAFIFVVTISLEVLGAFLLSGMWSGICESVPQKWFFSIFHSISAFCNAGFSLLDNSLIGYSGLWQVYWVIGVLIILGGVGFGVLYDIAGVSFDFFCRIFRRLIRPAEVFQPRTRKRLSLQTKLVLITSLVLILSGMLLILVLENNCGQNITHKSCGARVSDALFQSVTARTAGFNTVDISSMSSASKVVLMILMFIGGSPGSTAGGIKTVTLAVLVMVTYATFRKRSEVEAFGRSIRLAVVGRAITVTLLFGVVFLSVSFVLSITERSSGFAMDDIMFETVSALGTVGLSCGLTENLTTAGKLIIIATMLIGRLGPLTLLAAMTFNLKPARYSYPDEPIIVG